jgi:hypothetical protein
MNKIHFVSRKGASAYLHEEWGITRSPKTLAKYATEGGGPSFRKDGKQALYDRADLNTYAESILSPLVKSTSELATLERDEVES